MQTAKQLISGQVVTGYPEQRLATVAVDIQKIGAQYCAVVAGDIPELIGLVRFSDVAARAPTSTRILSDLMKAPPAQRVKEHDSAEAVQQIFETFGVQEISVISSSGAFVGLITPESFAGWLLENERQRKQQLEQLLAEQKRLMRFVEGKVAERMTELRQTLDEFGTLCLSLSHDIRAPLRSIKGFAEVIDEDREQLTPGALKAVGRIRDITLRTEELAENLLGRARKAFGTQAEAFVAIDLNGVYQDALQFLDALVRHTQASVTSREPLHKVAGYYVPVLQIFINLIGNALQHAPKDKPPAIEVWTEEQNDSIVLRIKDNGPGLGPQQRQTLFSPFMTRREGSEDGNGLGLSIVKNAASGLGGTVEATSLDGVGSVFSVTLQRTEQPAALAPVN